jgi:chemotaxis protein MotB
MRDRRRPAPHISHERWLVSYADFVTLLFAFFVVLYASAQIDKKKALGLSSAIESAFQQLGAFQGNLPKSKISLDAAANRASQNLDSSAARNLSRVDLATVGNQEGFHPKENLDAIRTELERALAAEIKRNEVALRLQDDGLVVSLREAGFFDSGSAALKPGGEAAFARVATILQEHACAVRIEGHTDTVPIHTAQFASNWELSTARATELVKKLIEDHGLAADRLSAAGYAEYHPVASNNSEKGRQMNRRVDVVILAPPIPSASPSSPARVDTGSAPGTGAPSAATGPALGGKAG